MCASDVCVGVVHACMTEIHKKTHASARTGCVRWVMGGDGSKGG